MRERVRTDIGAAVIELNELADRAGIPWEEVGLPVPDQQDAREEPRIVEPRPFVTTLERPPEVAMNGVADAPRARGIENRCNLHDIV